MRFDALKEAAVGNCLVRIRSSRVELPGAAGWISSWKIYRLPWHRRKLPVHTGETDVGGSGDGDGTDYCYNFCGCVLTWVGLLSA